MGKENLLSVNFRDIERSDGAFAMHFPCHFFVKDEDLEGEDEYVDIIAADTSVSDYADAVFEELEETGHGAFVRMANMFANRFFKQDQTFFKLGISRTIDVLSPQITEEPLSYYYLKQIPSQIKKSIIPDPEVEGDTVVDSSWHIDRLDPSIIKWRDEVLEDLEEDEFKEDFNAGFLFATIGFALREYDKRCGANEGPR